MKTLKVEITNATRLAQEGKDTVLLSVGDVLELPADDAYALIGNGKAIVTKQNVGRAKVATPPGGPQTPPPA